MLFSPRSVMNALFLALPLSAATAAPINWAQPPVGCIEEMNAIDMSPEKDTKIQEIYNASDRHGIPPQVLFGALMQESNLKNLGLTADGGNYSCGIGQLNVREWCEWANRQEPAMRKEIHWPSANIPCDEASLPAGIVAPFFDLMNGKAGPKAPHVNSYAGITPAMVEASLSTIKAPVPTDGTEAPPDITITPELVSARFQAASSFTRSCRDVRKSIRAKGLALKILFDTAVPAALRKIDLYKNGEHYERQCMRSNGKAYPLHTGWLTAVAMYNAGKKFVPRLASYYRMTKESFELDRTWTGFNPVKLIEGLNGGGRFNPETKELNYLDFDGHPVEASWFKACIVQQHITRVIKYVTLPEHVIAKTLVTKGCKQLAPPERQTSSGFYDVR